MDPEIISAIITSAVTLVVGVPTFIALVIAIRELRESARQNKVAVYQKTVDTEHDLFRMITKDPDLLRLCVVHRKLSTFKLSIGRMNLNIV